MMIRPDGYRTRWILVALFAVAMAWVESASVFYLRTLVDRVEPYQTHPLPMKDGFSAVELVREAATLVMLLAVGLLAGRTMLGGLGYASMAFGVWDIFYYVFLRMMSGWPHSLLDWDVLFLLPVPWWGPVLAPVSIALLMIVWGTLAGQREDRRPGQTLSWTVPALSAAGIALALYLFMADSFYAIRQGLDVTRQLPVSFNWPLFAVAFLLMAAGVSQFAWQTRSR
jgi:hypothetical protein